MRALILCAGKGTRLGLKKTPKCMVKVNGKPVLEYLVNHLNKHGVTEIIVNVHQNYDKIFKYFGTRLLYLYEPTLLGEAGTINLLQDFLGEEYIVMNGDTLTNVNITKMLKIHRQGKHSATLFMKHHFAGTVIHTKGIKDNIFWYNNPDEYYFDCGTPKKLAKARRFLCKKP